MVWHRMVWYFMGKYGMTCYGMVWYVMFGMIWNGMVLHGMAVHAAPDRMRDEAPCMIYSRPAPLHDTVCACFACVFHKRDGKL